MSIDIKEVKDKKDLKTFIYLPEKIHKNHKNWVHPLYMDEKKFFSKKENPMFHHNKTILLLAFRNQKPVGRIMGVIPLDFNEMNNVKTARFSYFECYEDKEIFDALLNRIENWAKENNCNEVIGPMGFSDKEPQGFLTKGFDEKTMLVTNCSFEFMQNFVKQSGYKPYVELCQYDVPLSEDILDRYQVFATSLPERLEVTVHEFHKIKDVKPFVRPVFELINSTYTEIYGFTKITQEEADEFGERFLPLLNPELIKILTNKENEVIAFIIAMPDLSQAMKKAKGRLFPFGWYHILRASKKSNVLMLLLGAIRNDMQRKGLDGVLAVHLIKSALKIGFKRMDSHLIMRENVKMRNEIERLKDFKMYKEYAIFSKKIDV
ncbi:MAG: hypothetical protein KGV44_08175 [Flavobacteriaceae bacterium]|nr:hypothetical protein [Flavobacteriaceae bacterium]